MTDPLARPQRTLGERDAAILEFEKQWWSFSGTKEAEIHDTIKRAIVESDERSTVHVFRTLRNTARVFK